MIDHKNLSLLVRNIREAFDEPLSTDSFREYLEGYAKAMPQFNEGEWADVILRSLPINIPPGAWFFVGSQVDLDHFLLVSTLYCYISSIGAVHLPITEEGHDYFRELRLQAHDMNMIRYWQGHRFQADNFSFRRVWPRLTPRQQQLVTIVLGVASLSTHPLTVYAARELKDLATLMEG